MQQRAPDELRDAEWLRVEYEEKGRSAQDIANELGVKTLTTVYRWMDRHGIERRSLTRANAKQGMTVAEAIEAQIESDERHDRQPTGDLFKRRIKAVIEAGAKDDKIVLRGALVDLIALCRRWAESIPFSTMVTFDE